MEVKELLGLYEERLVQHDNNRKEVQDQLHEICNGLRRQIDEFENSISGELEEKFNVEDSRLQAIVIRLRESADKDGEGASSVIQRAKAEFIAMQSYELVKCDLNERNNNNNNNDDEPVLKKRRLGLIPSLTNMYKLEIKRKTVCLNCIDFDERKPSEVTPAFTDKGELSLSFTFFSEDEVKVLKIIDPTFNVIIKIYEKSKGEEGAKIIAKEYTIGESVCFIESFNPSTTYCVGVRIEYQDLASEWGENVEFNTPEFKDLCVWKECPEFIARRMKYSIDFKNPRIASKIHDYDFCTIIGNVSLSLNKVTSWNIKILKLKYNDGNGIYIGVAPFDIDQNQVCNCANCGWYFNCHKSTLRSGPPHKYYDKKEYGPRKKDGNYVHAGDSVGVVMDTTKGELSFILDGVNLGVAYEGIPLDKPLVPCVILQCGGDSVELLT